MSARTLTRLIALAAIAWAALLTTAGPAVAKYMAIRGVGAPGPASYDRVWVETFGPSSAKTVFVIVPGTNGAAGSVSPVARDLAERVKGLQVWAVDRREVALEDRSGFGAATDQAAEDYYLGFKYKQADPKALPFVGDWGLATQTGDLRRVILKASAGGARKVILGGHSRGASQAAAYAAWDFKGRPGFEDLAGLVLIDGGALGFLGKGDSSLSLAGARKGLADIRAGKVFHDPLGVGIPSIGPVFLELGARYGLDAPSAPSGLQDSPILPVALRPPFPVTNRAFLGWLFDKDTAIPSFAALRIHAGRLGDGAPRDWIDGEITPIERLIGAFAGSATHPGGAEWYYPQRLILDLAAANAMRRDRASDMLGLRLWHTREIDTPLYAFQTDLTGGRVEAGAKRLVKRSKIASPTIVSDVGMSHLDPILGTPGPNEFFNTVVPFLEDRVG